METHDLDELGLPFCTAASAPGAAGAVDGAAADRAALEVLYRATGGDNWDDNDNWLSDAPLHSWLGVTTDSGGRVTKLLLAGNRLSGELPAELGNLANLTRLKLSDNALRGPLPAELGNLANLERLELEDNELRGPLPAELGNLANLTRLYLAGNPLSGCLPAAWSGVETHDLEELGLPFCAAADGAAVDRAALEALYRATGGDNWDDNDNWLSDAPLDAWLGVTTDSGGRVTKLLLAGNGLNGELPGRTGQPRQPDAAQTQRQRVARPDSTRTRQPRQPGTAGTRRQPVERGPSRPNWATSPT